MSLTDHMHPDELVSSAGALWRDGHVLMRGVLDGDSVSSLRPEFVQTVEQHRAEWPTKVLQAKKETVGGTQAQFDRIFGVHHTKNFSGSTRSCFVCGHPGESGVHRYGVSWEVHRDRFVRIIFRVRSGRAPGEPPQWSPAA